MSAPVRLQLSRRRGFDLQALSRATNGLPAVKVTRPGPWGNPFDFRPSDFCWVALAFGCRGDAAGRQEAAVKAFRDWIAPPHGRQTLRIELQVTLVDTPIGAKMEAGQAPSRTQIETGLRARNLACWCAPGAPCHANVLLELANGPVCEAVV